MNNTQPLLFDIPSIAETGVWCRLADGIDPAEWAGLCREIGQMSPCRFEEVNECISGQPRSQRKSSPDSLISRFKRVFTFNQAEVKHLPLVSIGPDRVG